MKLKLVIPNSLSDIKLSQYQKFIRTTKDSEDDSFIARQMVGIFCGIPDDIVGSIRASDYDEIIRQISKVLKETPKHKQTFKIDGIEYGFMPKLDDMTVDEKADLDSYYKDVKDLHRAMAVLYRPIVAKSNGGYSIEDYDSKKHQKLDVKLDVVFGANVFFSNLTNALLSYTQSFIKTQVAHNTEASQILEQNGVGINHTLDSLKVISQNLMKWAS